MISRSTPSKKEDLGEIIHSVLAYSDIYPRATLVRGDQEDFDCLSLIPRALFMFMIRDISPPSELKCSKMTFKTKPQIR